MSEASEATSSQLFVRQSSGLVRNVSVTNALFFNVAAFVGVGLTLYPIFYSLGFIPVWQKGPFSSYGWAAIIAGLFCVVLAFIFTAFTSVMPRSGGDYVFTSRIVHPFMGWLESWTLVVGSVLIIAFEVPFVLRNLQITARIIGIGTGWHFADHANTWFTDSTGGITGTPGFIGCLVVLALIAAIVLLPTRTFHKVVTALAIVGVSAFVLMFIFGLLATHRSDLQNHLPRYTNGVTAQHIAATGKDPFLPGYSHNFLSDLFSRTVFPFMLSILLFQYIGFQYSAYIAGEVRGNVKRSVSFALIGALIVGVLANSVYIDALSRHFGFDLNVSWGASYWGFNDHLTTLPMGQPNSMPLLAVVANKTLWPLWALISFAGMIFPFLLCPVYINFISRIQLAWGLDRQVPSWFAEVNPRLRAPLNAILATLGLTLLFIFFQCYNVVPHIFATTGNKLNLAGTAWFSITMLGLTWIMPGINAIFARMRRPELMRNAPYGSLLPILGIVWLVFPLWIYILAVIKPIWDSLTTSGTNRLTYLETNGILDAILFYAIGIVIYIIMRLRTRAQGVDADMLFATIPPD
ncbi:MAG TPA: APC family permease [Gaiellales bacterium]|jgi:amino acid transporter|nr:APC family permease [Gaiellales bacterium]